MSILFREIANYDVDKDASKYSANFKEFNQKKTLKEYDESDSNGFEVNIEAMHFDVITENFTRYKPQCGSDEYLRTWLSPYEAPVIMYHNDHDGVVVGRVIKATVAESKVNSGSKCLLLTTTAPNQSTRRDIENKILKTVSVGVESNDVRCSICGSQLAHGDRCEHTRGHTYDGKLCVWDIYDMEATELSYVIVPSDPYAQVISYKYDQTDPKAVIEPKHILKNSKDKDEQKLQLKEGKSFNMDLKEQLESKTTELKEAKSQIEHLEIEKKTLNNDKISLNESVIELNKDKLRLQEELKEYKTKLEASATEVTAERQLKEAAEAKVTELEKEVKMSLIESFAALRMQANRSEIAREKLEERSIETLRTNIEDLKTDLKEAQQKGLANSVQSEGIAIEEPDAGNTTKLKESVEDGLETSFSL